MKQNVYNETRSFWSTHGRICLEVPAFTPLLYFHALLSFKVEKKNWLKNTRNWASLTYTLYEINLIFFMIFKKYTVISPNEGREYLKTKPSTWHYFLIGRMSMAIYECSEYTDKGLKYSCGPPTCLPPFLHLSFLSSPISPCSLYLSIFLS